MIEFLRERNSKAERGGKPIWECRIGIHTGELIAGVIGKNKFVYDVWGVSVNTASRMESAGEPGKVNISGITYQLVKDKFICERRGNIEVKNMGKMDMYFVDKIR
jgi:class 3 adenylate cyclase